MTNTPNGLRYALAPFGAVIVAMIAITLGATVAKKLFLVVGPAGTTALRLTLAAFMLSVAFRIWRVPVTRTMLRAAVPYGASLGAMNLLFYMAIARIPLGIALAFEFIGPLAVATFSSRHLRDFGWIALAVIGLRLLLPTQTDGHPLDPDGIAFALVAGVFWGAYIIMGRRAGTVLGAEAPAFGMIVGALLAIPFGIVESGSGLLAPPVLGLALVVALLSSAIPYSLEMFALRRLPTRTFGVLTSGEPAVGAVMGALFLQEKLPLAKWLGIAGIVGASIGTTIFSRSRRGTPDDEREHFLEN
ncbi:MAG TPA: DMT family transporter [Sphingobium sp.]|uniref:EamA family transporter n=1 Tax=Sphingobium sp. TaxID=1912891 RepID=UPI002ED58637